MKKLLCFLVFAAGPACALAQDAPGGLIRTLRLGLDLPGSLSVADAHTDSAPDTNAGVMAGFELIRGYNRLGAGLGLELLPRRGLDRASKAAFGFLSIPLTLEFSDYGNYRNGALTPYFRLRGGLSFFLPGDAFLGGARNDGAGACAGIGAGIRKKQGLTAELMFNVYQASLDHGKTRLLYSAPRLSAGYSF